MTTIKSIERDRVELITVGQHTHHKRYHTFPVGKSDNICCNNVESFASSIETWDDRNKQTQAWASPVRTCGVGAKMQGGNPHIQDRSTPYVQTTLHHISHHVAQKKHVNANVAKTVSILVFSTLLAGARK